MWRDLSEREREREREREMQLLLLYLPVVMCIFFPGHHCRIYLLFNEYARVQEEKNI